MACDFRIELSQNIPTIWLSMLPIGSHQESSDFKVCTGHQQQGALGRSCFMQRQPDNKSSLMISHILSGISILGWQSKKGLHFCGVLRETGYNFSGTVYIEQWPHFISLGDFEFQVSKHLVSLHTIDAHGKEGALERCWNWQLPSLELLATFRWDSPLVSSNMACWKIDHLDFGDFPHKNHIHIIYIYVYWLDFPASHVWWHHIRV